VATLTNLSFNSLVAFLREFESLRQAQLVPASRPYAREVSRAGESLTSDVKARRNRVGDVLGACLDSPKGY